MNAYLPVLVDILVRVAVTTYPLAAHETLFRLLDAEHVALVTPIAVGNVIENLSPLSNDAAVTVKIILYEVDVLSVDTVGNTDILSIVGTVVIVREKPLTSSIR